MKNTINVGSSQVMNNNAYNRNNSIIRQSKFNVSSSGKKHPTNYDLVSTLLPENMGTNYDLKHLGGYKSSLHQSMKMPEGQRQL